VARRSKQTWAPYDVALAHERRGFAFSEQDDVAGIDIDDCVDESGQIADWAKEIIDELDSYAEISPSQHGVKIWVRGKLPQNISRPYESGKVELYDHAKYFTVTGTWVPGTPTTINRRQLALEGLYRRLAGSNDSPAVKSLELPPATGLSDEQVISKLMTDKYGPENARLWAGNLSDVEGDVSSADWRLVRRIVFYTGGDPEQVKRIMWRSKLVRGP